ncbi:MAG: hypothetical protein RL272_406 [Candidatus Parcubacteria bacterium]|jgi:hypothetical protein
MDDFGGTVLRFPLLPRMRILQIIERCPALGAIAARLPAEDDPRRVDCERVLAQAFTLLLHLPDVTREQADAALDHSAGAEAVTVEELARILRDPETAERYEIWRAVWESEDDPQTRTFARYCVALMSRLYRLESFARAESSRDAHSARSA